MIQTLFFVVAVMIVAYGCATVEQKHDIITVIPTTITPALKEDTSLKALPYERIRFKLEVPSELLTVLKVQRENVELREGPGLDFPLHHQFLQKGELLILENELGIWRRVYAINRQLRGWLHYRTIEKTQDQTSNIIIPSYQMPRVFTVRQLNQVLDYKSQKPVSYKVPRGHGFPALKKQGGLTLVYLSETRSIAWIPSRKLQ